jgi:hypothetical protein
MNDSLGVRCLQAVGQLRAQPQHFSFGEGPGCEFVVESDAGDQFHHEDVNSVFAAKLLDGLNVRMVQAGESQRLAAKTLACGFVGERARG